MNITSDKEYIVFKNDKGKYSISISKKNADGTYESTYIPIQFNKDVEVEDRARIKIKTAWLSFYKITKEFKGGRQTTPVFFIRCSEFEKEEVSPEPPKNPYEEFATKTQFDVGHQIQIDESDLPF